MAYSAEVETELDMLQEATDGAVAEGWDKEDALSTLAGLLDRTYPQELRKALEDFAALRKQRLEEATK